MRKEILSLGFSQFHELCRRVNSQDSFSDDRKNIFRNEVYELSRAFLAIDINSLSPQEIYDHDSRMKTFREWMLALDSSNGYTLSREMRAVLDNLCSLWVDDPEKFIFSATDGSFAITRYSKLVSSWDMVADNYGKLYGVRPSYQIITITTPKQLCSDFFFIGSLYHEMGHFVTAYYNIVDKVRDRIKKRLADPAEKDKIENEYFPRIQKAVKPDGTIDEAYRDRILENHIDEYISDLFGTQYLGIHIGNHIEYISFGYYDVDSDSHPSPIKRQNLKEAFLKNDKSNFLLQDIIAEFNDIGRPLKKRWVTPADLSNLEKGNPITVNNEDELHSLFIVAWDVFLRGSKKMDKLNGNPEGTLSQHEFYIKLNDAVKQSIHLYFKLP